MKIIGVTGGVGSGKTELLHYIEKNYRCRILLADEASHEVMQKGGRIYEPLVALLGSSVLDSSGEINRKEMAARIFSQEDLLGRVNALIHPAVREFILEAVAEEREKAAAGADDAVDYFFLEAALLIECGYRSVVDEMWYIYCDLAVRRERLKKSRGYSDEKIDSILSSQLTEAQFRSGSDVIIDNSGNLEDAYRQIREALASGERK